MAVAVSQYMQRHSSPAHQHLDMQRVWTCREWKIIYVFMWCHAFDEHPEHTHTHRRRHTNTEHAERLLSNAHSRIMRPYLKLTLRLSVDTLGPVCCVCLWRRRVCMRVAHQTSFKNVCSVATSAMHGNENSFFSFSVNLVVSLFVNVNLDLFRVKSYEYILIHSECIKIYELLVRCAIRFDWMLAPKYIISFKEAKGMAFRFIDENLRCGLIVFV